MMKKKKCVFLVSSLDAGGAETYLLRFLAFSESTIDPIVITKAGKKGALLSEYEKYTSKILTVNSGYLSLIAWFELFKIIKKEKPSSICDFTGNFAGIPLLIGRLLKVPTRIAFYRRSSNAFKETVFNLAYNSLMNRLVLYSATRILANSYAGLSFFFKEKQNDSRMQVIRNGIDIELFKARATKEELRAHFQIRSDCFVIGHTGRLNSAKNHETLIAVAAELKKAGFDFQLVLCGKDTDKLLDNLPDSLTKSDVISLGYQTVIPDVLKTFDFYFFPSVTEGMPNALMEAMVSGLPFVASNIASIKEIVPVQNHSQLFEPTDVQAFSTFFKGIFLNNDSIQSMSCESFAKEQYNNELQFSAFLREI
ncbi:glycosyltransferase [Flavobacterium sp.]|uniref:glycosyltransferase n=1 Tax=Flavobacterium sp. TaxID=239 RepID=UPI003B9A1AC7